MKHIVLGTAGHVDHGKTTLVKALTKVDTDRLKEEKERGITIELGFAPLRLDDKTFVGIVDVPGHERFVKNMVAGAAGIDMVVLVIAADEGIMPQTREHLSICELLNVRMGLVALTKIDLVDNEWLELAKSEIEDFLHGTFLEGAPLIPLSAQSGEGLRDFVDVLRTMVVEMEISDQPDIFRLPVDRVFTIKGFGTVVTGTMPSGRVAVGDTVTILPSGEITKVRGIQVHGETRREAEPGFRTAVNFQGLEKEAVRRGDVIAHPMIFEPSSRMDIFIRLLPTAGRALKNRALVRFHIGTAEIMGRVCLFDRENLTPGEEAYAQVLLEEPTVAMTGDRFVIRSYSPVTTIGGGSVIDPMGTKPRKPYTDILNEMDAIYRGGVREKTEIILKRSGLEGISLNRLVTRTGISPGKQQAVLEELFSTKSALLLDREERGAISWGAYEKLTRDILTYLDDYHRRFPLKKGPSREELRISLRRRITPRLFNKALLDLENRVLISVDGDSIARKGHDVRLGGDMGKLKNSLVKVYREAGLTPPSTKEVIERLEAGEGDTKKILAHLVEENILIKINDDMYFDRGALERLKTEYRSRLLEKERFTPADFKEMTGLSRKYIIPLMEYFDKTNLTIRVGNERRLREREKR